MSSNMIGKVFKSFKYKYLLLRKNFKKLEEAIKSEGDMETKYHLEFEKDIALQKYDMCFEVLKNADRDNALLEKDIELYIKGILAKYEKDKNYKKVVVISLDILDWANVSIRLKSMVYHLLGNSYYYSNKEKELVDLVEFLKRDKNYRNHPLVKWANTPVIEKSTKKKEV